MDKYEYKLKLEQLNTLVEAKDYKTAAQIASGINWRKVKSVATLCMVGEIFERNYQYEVSREILLMAYDRSPVGRNIIYRLTLVALKMGNLEEAQEYYEEFIEVAPHDNMKYVLKYEIARVKGVGTDELIAILEEFKEREYTEEWAFELAYLYHRSGKPEKCVEICDELILWFGEGSYVEKALELKMIYQPLNKLQEDKYRRIKMKAEGIPEDVTEVSPRDIKTSGAMLSDTVRIPSIHADTGRFNTVNLQAELVKGMQQIMDATEPEMVTDAMDNIKKMVGEMPSLYQSGEEPGMEEPGMEDAEGLEEEWQQEEEPGEITKRYGPIGALDAGLEESAMIFWQSGSGPRRPPGQPLQRRSSVSWSRRSCVRCSRRRTLWSCSTRWSRGWRAWFSLSRPPAGIRSSRRRRKHGRKPWRRPGFRRIFRRPDRSFTQSGREVCSPAQRRFRK